MSRWLIVTDFQFGSGVAPDGNRTLTGMELFFYWEGKKLQVPRDSIRLVLPPGSPGSPWQKRNVPNQLYTAPDASVTLTYSLGNGADLWNTTENYNIQDFDMRNAAAGFAIHFAQPFPDPEGFNDDERVRFFTAGMRLYSVVPGEPTTTPAAGEGGEGGEGTGQEASNAPPPSNAARVGIIVGAVIGGLLLIALVVFVIALLVRRARVSQPAVRLDAPLSDYQTF